MLNELKKLSNGMLSLHGYPAATGRLRLLAPDSARPAHGGQRTHSGGGRRRDWPTRVEPAALVMISASSFLLLCTAWFGLATL